MEVAGKGYVPSGSLTHSHSLHLSHLTSLRSLGLCNKACYNIPAVLTLYHLFTPAYWDLMYQSNRSFNIPPGQPPGHLNFWKTFGKFPPPWVEKLFKCLHPHMPSGEERGLISLTAAGNRDKKIIVYIVKTILIHLHI